MGLPLILFGLVLFGFPFFLPFLPFLRHHLALLILIALLIFQSLPVSVVFFVIVVVFIFVFVPISIPFRHMFHLFVC